MYVLNSLVFSALPTGSNVLSNISVGKCFSEGFYSGINELVVEADVVSV